VSVRVLVFLFLITASVSAWSNEPDSYIRDFQIPPGEEIGPDVLLAESGLPTSPPADPQVGDSWVWWLWTWYPMPPHFEQHVCTVRGMSSHGYVVVKDSEWLVSIDQNDVDAILEHWENSSIGPYPNQGIYEIDSLSFGTPPDELDDDPRIYLMWYDFEVAADGFFFYFDEYPEGTFPEYHSNECEVLYLNTQSTGGPSGSYMHGVIAHEFEHLIHWKQDENETSWVDEGMAELAMYFFGHPDNISSFNANPDNNLTVWDGAWADYIQTYLWSLYFFERYGGHDAVYSLVQEQANSMAGYDAVLDYYGYTENTEDMFADWAVANFLDDTSIEDGRYGYTGEDLPPFSTSGVFSSYPVEEERTVNNWAADYYKLQNFPFQELEITFDGSDDNTFAVRAIVQRSAQPCEVIEVPLDEPTQTGVTTVGDLNQPEDHVILVVASVSSTGGDQYQFSAGEAMGVSGEEEGSQGSSFLRPEINPFRDSVSFQLGGSVEPGHEVLIYDINGRQAAQLLADEHGEAVWDAGSNGPGVYFAMIQNGTETVCTRILKLP